MATWDMTFSGSDFTDIDVINMLHEAIWEREAAGPYTISYEPNTTVAGDDVQAYYFWYLMQQRAESLFGSAEAGGQKWITGAFNLDGVPGTWSWGVDPISEITPTPYIDTNGITGIFDQLALGGWMRKRPREIDTTASWYDTQGNPRADGQRARCLADGKVYQFIGIPTYEWHLAAAGETPDLLTGEAGEERVIDDTSATEDQAGHPAEHGQHARSYADSLVYVYIDGVGWVADEEDPSAPPDQITTTGSGVIFGKVQPGDYLGEWILTELRDVISATGNRTFASGMNFADGLGTHAQGGVYDWRIEPGHPTVTSLTIANELCALNWIPGEEHHGDPDLDTITYSGRDKTFISCAIGETFFIEVYADRYPSKHSTRTAGHRDRTVQMYAIADKIEVGAGTTTSVFNAFGTGLVENTFKPIGTALSVTTGVYDSAFVTVDPAPTIQPANPTAPSPPTTTFSVHGVKVTFTIGVVTWDFVWM